MPVHLKTRLTFAAALALHALSASGATSTAFDHGHAFERDVDTLMQAHVTQDNWAGNLAVVYAGQTVLRRSYGIADRTWHIATRPDDVYRIGSTTKMLTAVAILQLVQAGKVALDAPVRTWLPDLPPAWQPITVRHLLNQRSGLAEFTSSTDSFRTLMRAERTPDAVLALVKDAPLRFTPGSKFEYSNTNYLALGLVIEKVTGKTYAGYIEDNVLRPAGMTHSGYFDDTRILLSLVPGYLRADGGLQNMFYISPSMLYAAGNLYSTMDDLLLWDRALHDTDVLGLSPASKAAMFHDAGGGYGFGAFIDRIDGETAVGHGGTLPGYQVGYERFMRLPLTVAVMGNVYPVDTDKITASVAKLFFKYCGKTAPAEQCDVTTHGPDAAHP